MALSRLSANMTPERLRKLLLLVFAALVVPTVVLIWQAWGQLKWESMHQYRGNAESVTRQVDQRLSGIIMEVNARSFSDFSFLVVSGDPAANLLQRSPLSEYPVDDVVPGTIGYFQVDDEGTFTTPLLPAAGTDPGTVGIDSAEQDQRVMLAGDLQAILLLNRLVERPATPFDAGTVATLEAADTESGFSSSFDYAQQAFDRLKSRDAYSEYKEQSDTAARQLPEELASEIVVTGARSNTLGSVDELELDDRFDVKDDSAAAKSPPPSAKSVAASSAPVSKRREQANLPEAVAEDAAEGAQPGRQGIDNYRISTFESELDPFELSLLDSGHLVLFRNVWRDGSRFIQGQLIDTELFLDDLVATAFATTTIDDVANMIVAYDDDIIFSLLRNVSPSRNRIDIGESLLYQGSLSDPFQRMQLIFGVDDLPPGPGASVLLWTTVLLSAVFIAAFMLIYRFGIEQINLARQQQDFVSAVSHELKTPLTSIRMYGEMLKEGWADDSKRQEYYEYIHDESERLARLISNVLQLARITRNDPQINSQRVTAAELMDQVESKIRNHVERADFELRINCAADAAKSSLNVDPDCFLQIVINLVDNAIKFSAKSEQRSIDVSCRRKREGTVVFSIRDYGDGIPADQMKKIFTLFYRSESELTRETVGTGIGLAIVQQLTTAMGGSVDVVNCEPGAEFSIEFREAGIVS